MASGQVIATYIELESALAEYKAIGIVAALDTTAETFDLGGVTVDYSGASLSEFEGAALSNGQLVEIRLPSANFTAPASAEATEVELLPVPEIEEGAEVEVEGYIDRFVSASDFSVGGVPVTANAATSYENGSSGELGLNVRVEVEGTANAAGVIVAEDIEFKSDKAIRVEGTVTDVDVTASTVTAMGLTFEIRGSTEMEDDRDDVEPFTIDNLLPGDYVEIRGVFRGSGHRGGGVRAGRCGHPRTTQRIADRLRQDRGNGGNSGCYRE